MRRSPRSANGQDQRRAVLTLGSTRRSSRLIIDGGKKDTGMEGALRTKPWEPIASSIAYWKPWSRMWENLVDPRRREGGSERGAPHRFDALVRFARAQSPFYREAYGRRPNATSIRASCPL
jgi:hypothetical protein